MFKILYYILKHNLQSYSVQIKQIVVVIMSLFLGPVVLLGSDLFSNPHLGWAYEGENETPG